MKLLPEGFKALLAPAAMLPASLLRPDALPMVPAEFAPMPGVPAAKDSWIEVVATSPARIVVIIVLRIVISLFAGPESKSLLSRHCAIACGLQNDVATTTLSRGLKSFLDSQAWFLAASKPGHPRGVRRDVDVPEKSFSRASPAATPFIGYTSKTEPCLLQCAGVSPEPSRNILLQYTHIERYAVEFAGATRAALKRPTKTHPQTF
jgi:hypothetical protein